MPANVAPHAVRAELRAPDPSCNPYLAFACIGACGLKGMAEGLELPQEMTRNLYHLSHEEITSYGVASLPPSLECAISHLENSTFAKDFLSEDLLDEFLKAKKEEALLYNTKISKAELE